MIESHDVFYSQASGIDWDVIFLMLGMMIIVSILRHTGIFEYVAIWAVKRANGSPLRIMILLILIMALASAVLPNVVSVLLIAPVTLLVCERLEFNPVPLLIAEVFASNIGGTATLVGDPPNIIIGARKGLSFNSFLVNMAPIVLVILLVFVAALPVLFRGLSAADPERVADVMTVDEKEAVQDRALLLKSVAVLLLVLVGFIVSEAIHLQPSLVALLGAGVLILISGLDNSDYHGQRRVGHPALHGRPVRHGRCAVQDRSHQDPRPDGIRRHRRQHAGDDDADPVRVDAAVRHHR